MAKFWGMKKKRISSVCATKRYAMNFCIANRDIHSRFIVERMPFKEHAAGLPFTTLCRVDCVLHLAIFYPVICILCSHFVFCASTIK